MSSELVPAREILRGEVVGCDLCYRSEPCGCAPGPCQCSCGGCATCERCDTKHALGDPCPDEREPAHTGHWSRLGGTWWCDTCNSPYCVLA